MGAAVNGHAETVQVLIKAGADVDSLFRDGSTALFKAVEYVSQTEIC